MSGFNIATFKARGLIEGGARPSLFSVRFPTVPPGVTDQTTDAEFLIQSASIPPSIVDQVDVPYFGRKIKVFGERSFQNWNITVMNDENFILRNMFESWSNKINTHVSNRYDLRGNMNEYKVDLVEVIQYGKAGPGDDNGVIRSYVLWGVWPVAVSAIPLDWGRTNTIESFDVELSIDYWEPGVIGANAGYEVDIDTQAGSSISAVTPAIS